MSNTNKWGIVAEFETTAAVYHAAEKVIAHGYTRVDAHTPFPVHVRATWAGSSSAAARPASPSPS
jgi:hypothetical protein